MVDVTSNFFPNFSGSVKFLTFNYWRRLS